MGRKYVGRFAPSPTGPLHFGSLVAALASFLDARHNGGMWLLRIEDLDPPRESAEAPAQIIAQLQALGLEWDGDILYQSGRLAAYRRALDELTEAGLTYPCTCSRRDVGPIYDGICRGKSFDMAEPYAIRFLVGDAEVRLEDRILGPRSWHLDKDVGDFIIRRKDGLLAYQLAVVVDDAFQQVSHVVRGNDLLDSTPKQIALFRSLGYATPSFAHLPVIVDDKGFKLSKQAGAQPIDTSEPVPLLRRALSALGQAPAGDGKLSTVLDRAITGWNIDRIGTRASIALSSLA